VRAPATLPPFFFRPRFGPRSPSSSLRPAPPLPLPGCLGGHGPPITPTPHDHPHPPLPPPLTDSSLKKPGPARHLNLAGPGAGGRSDCPSRDTRVNLSASPVIGRPPVPWQDYLQSSQGPRSPRSGGAAVDASAGLPVFPAGCATSCWSLPIIVLAPPAPPPPTFPSDVRITGPFAVCYVNTFPPSHPPQTQTMDVSPCPLPFRNVLRHPWPVPPFHPPHPRGFGSPRSRPSPYPGNLISSFRAQTTHTLPV